MERPAGVGIGMRVCLSMNVRDLARSIPKEQLRKELAAKLEADPDVVRE